MVWAQVFSFVALQFFDKDIKGSITVFLIGSFALWLLLNTAFFCTIDLSYLNTFIEKKTRATILVRPFFSS